jgi:hypothetical protein
MQSPAEMILPLSPQFRITNHVDTPSSVCLCLGLGLGLAHGIDLCSARYLSQLKSSDRVSALHWVDMSLAGYLYVAHMKLVPDSPDEVVAKGLVFGSPRAVSDGLLFSWAHGLVLELHRRWGDS